MRRPGLPLLLLLALVAACGSTTSRATDAPSATADDRATGSPTPSATPSPEPSAFSSLGPAVEAAVPGPTGPRTAVADGLRPVRITIAAIGVDAALGDLGIRKDGSIEVPADPSRAGWVDRTPAPGQQGPSVIAGHVDSTTGPAVFYRLGRLHAGDRVVVTRRDGSRVTFAIDEVQTYPKKHFPTRATYGPVPVPALRLITCGGSYDKSAGGYQANVVAFASEV